MNAQRPLATVALLALATAAHAEAPDPRLREVTYDPKAVVTVPTRRGEVTLIVLAPDEQITELAAGLASDCARPESPWCVVAQPGGRTVFAKPKSTAQAANNLAIVTDKRTHALRLTVLADNDSKPPVYRLTIKAPAPPASPSVQQAGSNQQPGLASASAQVLALLKTQVASPTRVLNERLQARPQVLNSHYTVSEGTASQDIVPTMVFDDGRFTYLKFPGNREVPAVFQVQADGSEALLNTRMDEDLLVVDRVSRKLVLRAGQAVVGVHNEAFDVDGIPPEDGTTVPGVRRVMRDGPARTSGQLNARGATP